MKRVLEIAIYDDDLSKIEVVEAHKDHKSKAKYYFESGLYDGIFTDQELGEYFADCFDSRCCTADLMFPILSAVDDVNCTLLDAYIKMVDSYKNPDARWCCGMTRDEFVKKRNKRADYWSELGYQNTHIN